MVAAGCTAEQIVAAVKADAQSDDARAAHRREVDAARKRRHRQADRADDVTICHADNAGQSVTTEDEVSPKKETSPTPPKEKTTPSQSEPNGSSKTPRQALECVLDSKHAADVVDHRKRIGKPMTVRAAELLADQLAQWHDPNEAADAMILNGWQGFKPEYLQNQRARGSPNRQPQPKYDPFKALAEELSDGQDRSERSDRRDWDDAQGVPIRTIEHHR
jgi:hypothetical protein